MISLLAAPPAELQFMNIAFPMVCEKKKTKDERERENDASFKCISHTTNDRIASLYDTFLRQQATGKRSVRNLHTVNLITCILYANVQTKLFPKTETGNEMMAIEVIRRIIYATVNKITQCLH